MKTRKRIKRTQILFRRISNVATGKYSCEAGEYLFPKLTFINLSYIGCEVFRKACSLPQFIPPVLETSVSMATGMVGFLIIANGLAGCALATNKAHRKVAHAFCITGTLFMTLGAYQFKQSTKHTHQENISVKAQQRK